ncbi:FtsJ-like methyltransferase-domain-containing protein [Radiomyces spectabilis]|uniref:FtsJ-like methyltransferase-domain-containing protein n=1 Tax=Radiomyces spectabilis TaxID=64574 RepID=UPI0022201350|nr:FtsJ-like methyltransferase-domain-containing protein [Radiomyces spectabilis]KAI8384517.1 FtsJ-like methyltransferase-domain-containing protein [Radiomyces spectabilis]
MDDHLYTDSEPGYRATHVDSRIPPPSTRDYLSSRSRNNHHSSNQNQRSRRYEPYHSNRSNDAPTRAPPASHSQYNDSPPAAPRSVQPEPPKQKPVLKIDFHANTDFVECATEPESKRYSVEDIVELIDIREAKTDVDFLSFGDVMQKLNALRLKTGRLSHEQLSSARQRSNPFEHIGKSIFMNRAATKLAALDATFQLTATELNKPLLFADICGGPGGFTEYLLWRTSSGGGSAHGYGITLKSSDDAANWHLEEMRRDIPLNFTQIDGVDGTGDLYKEANIREFAAVVSNHTKKRGVDLVVADGGFDFTGKEHMQEQLARKLILCEIITMLTCLKQGGTFVCKFFDMMEDFTADLVWLLYQLFDRICITKPLTSRPANSERYVVCKNLRPGHPIKLIEALLDVNRKLDENATKDICFVPRSVLEKDETFVNYVKMRNMKFAVKQTETLEQFGQFVNDPHRPATYDQNQVRRQCLNEWHLPLSENEP